MKKIGLLILIIITLHINNTYAQNDTCEYRFYFRVNKHTLDSGYLNNNETIKQIHNILYNKDLVKNIDSINIISSASPDGNIEFNEWLSQKRGLATKGYFMWKYPSLNREIINIQSKGENWNGLREIVQQDNNIPHRDEVLRIINKDISLEKKELELKNLENGSAWKYLKNNYLHSLRSCTTCFIFYNINNQENKSQNIELEDIHLPDKQLIEDTIKTTTDIQIQQKEFYLKPIFALKTNLLFDVVSGVNVEVEVPIGKKISLSGEWIFPWWKSTNAKFTMDILSGGGAIKYWLGNRENKNVLTGWNIGIAGGGGKYDIQLFTEKGYQGEFFNVGMQGGYAHSIGKNFRLEYSIGLGYFSSRYERYYQENNTEYGDIKVVKYPWEKKKRNLIGLNTLKISLVWLIDSKIYKRI